MSAQENELDAATKAAKELVDLYYYCNEEEAYALRVYEPLILDYEIFGRSWRGGGHSVCKARVPRGTRVTWRVKDDEITISYTDGNGAEREQSHRCPNVRTVWANEASGSAIIK